MGRTWEKASTITGVVILGVVLVGAMGSSAASMLGANDGRWPTADSLVFAGLPKDVVNEVLANPRAQRNVKMWPSAATDQRNALWQGMVINFVECRNVLAAYQSWNSSGKVPTLPAVALPATPVGAVVKDAMLVDGFYRSEIKSGDVARLRVDLLNESGCGVWIPARPGDATGPTIADTIK